MYGYNLSRGFWDQFSDMQGVLDELGRTFFARPLGLLRDAADFPAVNVWGSEDGVAITAEIPGADAESIELSVVGDTLTISGKRELRVPEGAKVLRSERSSLEFTRSIQLPFPCESDKADAEYRDGVLYVSLHRREQDRPKRISVKTA